MSSCLKVGILGAGRMAQGFDAPGASKVLSLAHAVAETPNFALGGFFDVDPAKATQAEVRWGCAATPRDRTAWLRLGFDVICIATPDECHAQDLADVLDCKPRAIVVEKPIATDPQLAKCLLHEAGSRGVPVIVDFPRRMHSGVIAVRDLISEGELGRPQMANLVFTGTAMHSAVHMVDLLHTWFEREWQALEVFRRGESGQVILGDGNCLLPVSLQALPESSFYAWEMKLFFERGSVELDGAPECMTVSRLGPHPNYPEFQVALPETRFNMEEEPLLERLFARVEELCRDPIEAKKQVRRELGSQTLISAILGLGSKIVAP